MKKNLILICSFLFVAGTTFAQDGKKALKNATRALSSFQLNNEEGKLQEAIDAIEIAVKDAEYGAQSKTWSTRGEIYNGVVNLNTTQNLLLGPDDQPKELIDPAAPFKAYESYKKSLELAEKGWEKKDALKGLSESVTNLNNVGIGEYESGNYEEAYKSFNAMLEVHKILKDNDEGSSLDDEDNYNNQVYITGLAALNSGMMDKATPLFTELETTTFEQPAIYDALYKINKEDNPEKAIGYLTKGREKYPTDVTLLFTEINHYLSAGEMEILEEKLKQAIEQEPDNASLHYTLGRVYVDVAAKKRKEKDQAGADEYLNKAVSKYNMAIEKNPEFYEAMYGIGELYYNKGANVSQEMQLLGTTKDDQKKYDEMKTEVEGIFSKALPYFQAAEKMNPNDNNTLVALSEIYARQNEFEKSKEFKSRIENLKSGGTNESYFKNN